MRLIRSILRWVKSLFTKVNMRRKISLYIADQLVDLDDQSFILFNYTMDDLSNPTVVKNSFSQQITLKGTPANNRVFGDSFRLDRRVAYGGSEAGVDFNASQKTPFTIYDEMGEILESGYVKLDSIDRRGADIQYKVTLYGGLGSFFYALSYDENGNKRTLADLDYLGTSNPDAELDFAITKDAVSAAWRRLQEDTTAPAMWDVINFAPAYNGIPEGNFAPDKGLADPLDISLRDSITQGSDEEAVTYTTQSKYCLVNLAEAQDEWAVKDLRSYLQRPVLSMRAFWNAICEPRNNGGYEVDASVLRDGVAFGQYVNLWMTLPLISSIGTFKKESGDLTLTMTSTATSGHSVGRFDITGSIPSGTKVTANLHCRVRFNLADADSYSRLYRSASNRDGRTTIVKSSVIFIQAVAYGSDDSVVGGSKVKVASDTRDFASVAAACGFVPTWAGGYERLDISSFTKVSSGVWQIPVELGFNVEAQDVAYYKIIVNTYQATTRIVSSGSGSQSETTYSGGNTSTPEMYADYNTGFTPASTFIVAGGTTDTVTYTTSDNLRSGARVTKAMLLSSSHTPAEYMLSFCKMFGLYFTYDVSSRKVTIVRRNELYQDETIDLTRRVDISKGVNIQPMVFNAKWYDFILDGVGGAFYDEYLNVEGIPYGIQRVNTGYDFNADSVNLMESVVFKNACTVLAKSRYFNAIFKISRNVEVPMSDFEERTWYMGQVIGGRLTISHAYANTYAIKMHVAVGDEISLTTTGARTGRAWYFLDEDERVVQCAAINFSGTVSLVIPSGVKYLVAQTNNGQITLIKEKASEFFPSPFLDKGNTYTLWSADGDTIETDISCPPSAASISYYNENPSLHGYDVDSARKLELRTADNKPIDGADVLVFLEGWNRYPYFKLTDDVPAMDLINEGVPCWLLGAGETDQDALNIPIFQRYVYGNIHLIEHSLDFGVPRQMDIPETMYKEDCVIYERAWKRYLADRYDVNTKVMTCRVNFGGMQVNRELLRKFYWYDNSLWVLNAIRNYSLTTYDPVECEFIQVQDKDNYLNGQQFN